MTVLANAHKCNVHRRGSYSGANSADDLCRISVTVKQVVFGYSRLLDQLFQQHLAEASRMGDWQTDVFIEMKQLYSLPIDIPRLGERVQELKLRSRSGRNHPGLAVILYSAANGGRCMLRGSLA